MKNSTDLVEPLSNLYGLEISKPTANPGRRSTVMELASATPLNGHDYSNFHTAVGKLIFMAPWRPDMQFAFQQLSTQVFNPTTDSKRPVKQLIRCLRRRTVGTPRTLQGTSLQRVSSSRDRFRLDKTHSTAQVTKRTRTYRNTMPCNTPVDPRETFVGESSGHEEQHWLSLHETSGWIFQDSRSRKKLGLRILDGTNGTHGDD